MSPRGITPSELSKSYSNSFCSIGKPGQLSSGAPCKSSWCDDTHRQAEDVSGKSTLTKARSTTWPVYTLSAEEVGSGCGAFLAFLDMSIQSASTQATRRAPT